MTVHSNTIEVCRENDIFVFQYRIAAFEKTNDIGADQRALFHFLSDRRNDAKVNCLVVVALD